MGRTSLTESIRSVRRDGVSGNVGEGENKGRNTRNLPYPKFLKRREEGMCFRCGGPFSLGHQCPKKSLRVVLLAEDEEGGEEGMEIETETPCMELSAFSIGGLTQPKTLKL